MKKSSRHDMETIFQFDGATRPKIDILIFANDHFSRVCTGRYMTAGNNIRGGMIPFGSSREESLPMGVYTERRCIPWGLPVLQRIEFMVCAIVNDGHIGMPIISYAVWIAIDHALVAEVFARVGIAGRIHRRVINIGILKVNVSRLLR